MNKTLFAFVTLFLSSSALAFTADFEIVTVDGQTVKVSEQSLRNAYNQLVVTTSNQVSTLEDGSTGVLKPSTMIAGISHAIAADTRYAVDFGTGLCKLRGFTRAVSGELDWSNPAGPVTLLNLNGGVIQTFAVAPVYVRAFRILICR